MREGRKEQFGWEAEGVKKQEEIRWDRKGRRENWTSVDGERLIVLEKSWESKIAKLIHTLDKRWSGIEKYYQAHECTGLKPPLEISGTHHFQMNVKCGTNTIIMSWR